MRRVLVTRPQADSEALAQQLARRDIEALIAPCMQIRQLMNIWQEPELLKQDWSAIVITSRHAVPSLAPTEWHNIPCLVVGAQTAAKVTLSGMRQVQHFDDAKSLIEHIKTISSWQNSVLYLRGLEVKADLKKTIPHVPWKEQIVYEAQAVEAWPDDVRKALQTEEIDGAIFLSPRSAKLTENLLEPFADKLSLLSAYCISQDTADALRLPMWQKKRVATQPHLQAILALL